VELNMGNFTAWSPSLSWQQIVLARRQESEQLPFLAYFAELDTADPKEWEMDVRRTDRIVEPVEGWQVYELTKRRWGKDQRMIEEWFDEGEELQHRELDVEIDEPDGWERAVTWVRSLAIATKLIPA
jgi:hypothetical protein